jgi:hypothetical protein
MRGWTTFGWVATVILPFDSVGKGVDTIAEICAEHLEKQKLFQCPQFAKFEGTFGRPLDTVQTNKCWQPSKTRFRGKLRAN